MADLQLIIDYKPAPLSPVFKSVAAMKWLCLIVIPTAWLVTALVLILVPAMHDCFFGPGICMLPLLAMAYLPTVAVGALLTWPAWKRDLKISKDGVVFPLLAILSERVGSNHTWSEFRSAAVALPDQDGKTKGKLLLSLDTGKRISLDLGGFEKSELEQLLLGIELWGNNLVRSPELIDYQARLQNETKGVDGVSYTNLWEEELSRRFKATSFLPLDPGHALQKGQLEVLKQLAFGGLSAIYLVQRNDIDVLVLKEAVVPANADHVVRREAEKHLARESQTLFRLNHPNIARVIDYFVEDARHYLLLEYINGQDLRQLVQQGGPQAQEQVLAWAMQLVIALEYLHSQDPPVIHRDVTPDNLVLRNDGTLMLIDFGASNEFLGTVTGTIIGKQAYMAPEQFRGKANCSSDMYAFGATMFFLLTGRDPSPLSTSHPGTVLPAISPELDELVASLTACDQKVRPQSASEVLSKLNHIRTGLSQRIEEGAAK